MSDTTPLLSPNQESALASQCTTSEPLSPPSHPAISPNPANQTELHKHRHALRRAIVWVKGLLNKVTRKGQLVACDPCCAKQTEALQNWAMLEEYREDLRKETQRVLEYEASVQKTDDEVGKALIQFELAVGEFDVQRGEFRREKEEFERREEAFGRMKEALREEMEEMEEMEMVLRAKRNASERESEKKKRIGKTRKLTAKRRDAVVQSAPIRRGSTAEKTKEQFSMLAEQMEYDYANKKWDEKHKKDA